MRLAASRLVDSFLLDLPPPSRMPARRLTRFGDAMLDTPERSFHDLWNDRSDA
jgi:hypothetical protein